MTMTMAMVMTNTRTTTMTTTINGVNTWFEQVYNCRVVYKAQTRDGKGVTQEDWRELSKADGVSTPFWTRRTQPNW